MGVPALSLSAKTDDDADPLVTESYMAMETPEPDTPDERDAVSVASRSPRDRRDVARPVGSYDRAGAHEADMVGYSVAGTTGCFVCHPDLVEQVLVTDADVYEKGQLLQDTLGQFIGEGLFLWKSRSGNNSARRSSRRSTGNASPPTATR